MTHRIQKTTYTVAYKPASSVAYSPATPAYSPAKPAYKSATPAYSPKALSYPREQQVPKNRKSKVKKYSYKSHVQCGPKEDFEYYTGGGKPIYNPDAYAATGAPMYENRNSKININEEKSIYKINCEDGKKYIGETNNFDRRMDQHFSGRGAKVTQKFRPLDSTELERVPGYFAKEIEQEYTEEYIEKYGYNNVRGGNYTNSKTLKSDDEEDLDNKNYNEDYEDYGGDY